MKSGYPHCVYIISIVFFLEYLVNFFTNYKFTPDSEPLIHFYRILPKIFIGSYSDEFFIRAHRLEP